MGAEQEIINIDKMQAFATAIEAVTGNNTVLAIDVFYVHKYKKTDIKSYTFAEKIYIDTILPEFLKTGSMGGVDGWKLEYKSYSNKNEKDVSNRTFKDDFSFDNVPETNATFESYVQHLEKNSYGKFCFWNNTNQKVGEAEANISVVVITANDNSSNVEKIKTVVYENLLSEFYRLIINTFLDINIEQAKTIIEHERDKEFIKAHKHTIRNFGFEDHLSSLKTKIESTTSADIAKDFETMNNLSLLRDITMDFIYTRDLTNAEIQRSLIVRKGINTYSQILQLIYDAQIDKSRAMFNIHDSVKEHSTNTIEEKNLMEVFGLLINLFSNARKNANGNNYSVSATIENDTLKIQFTNSKQLVSKYVEYLTQTDTSLPEIVPSQGLCIIKNALTRLSSIGLTIEAQQNKTEISLIIKNKTV